jgi:hypothetical protein
MRPVCGWMAAIVAAASSARDDEIIGGFAGGVPLVPVEEPGVDAVPAVPMFGEFAGCPLPGIRFVLQPAVARRNAMESAPAARAPRSRARFGFVFLTIWSPCRRKLHRYLEQWMCPSTCAVRFDRRMAGTTVATDQRGKKEGPCNEP